MSVVAPDSTEEVSAVLAEASETETRVRVRGGGTRSRRGRPLEPDLTLSLFNLRGVVDYVAPDMTVTVRAGTPVTELLDELADGRQVWPYPDLRPQSTVGGVLATASSGLARLRFGPIRDSLLEVVAATGDGRVIRAGARTVKSVAGYDLPRLLVGADGTLGVILQATLRLWPRPARLGWFRSEGPLETLVEHAGGLARDPRRPWSVVLVPGALWVQLAGEESSVEAPPGMEGADEEHGPAVPAGAGVVLIGVPAPALPSALARLDGDGHGYRAQVGVGSIEVAVESAEDVARVRALATSLGGHAVVIDGPPELRGDPIGPDPPGVGIMRRLRDEFDPAGILNGGCVPWEPAA